MNRRYCNGMVHVIKPGDTLYQISRYYRIPMAMLLRANPYVDVYNLQVGQEICIPMVRAHQGMICMPVPKDEPLPVTAVTEEDAKEQMPVESQETDSIGDEVPDPREEELKEEKKVYITDGKQSLGEILMAHETKLEEFVKMNDLDQMTLKEDQILYFTK